MPCCPTRSSKSNPAARSTAITMFESLTDEGYIPCVSLLDFQKTGGKLDIRLYPETRRQMDSWLEESNSKNRNEFVEKALRFYMGYSVL